MDTHTKTPSALRPPITWEGVIAAPCQAMAEALAARAALLALEGVDAARVELEAFAATPGAVAWRCEATTSRRIGDADGPGASWRGPTVSVKITGPDGVTDHSEWEPDNRLRSWPQVRDHRDRWAAAVSDTAAGG